jgi:hypothetical protein
VKKSGHREKTQPEAGPPLAEKNNDPQEHVPTGKKFAKISSAIAAIFIGAFLFLRGKG